jgi:hypothetical protein
MSPAARARTITPPTTPPTIAPVLLELFEVELTEADADDVELPSAWADGVWPFEVLTAGAWELCEGAFLLVVMIAAVLEPGLEPAGYAALEVGLDAALDAALRPTTEAMLSVEAVVVVDVDGSVASKVSAAVLTEAHSHDVRVSR